METIELASGLRLRAWRLQDADALVRHANDREIWLNLRDRFPHPYTATDAQSYLAHVCDRQPTTRFAIEVDGEASGGIGLELGTDVERCGAELGYWLGRRHWGRGIMTKAVAAVAEYGLGELALRRIFALPYARNEASARVLEKAGFEREGLLRHSAMKDGVLQDQWMFSKVR